jgi:alpha-galactosidase
MNTTRKWVDDYELKPQVATITNLAAAEDANNSTNVRHFRCDVDGTSWSGEANCPKCGKATLPYMSRSPETLDTTELFDPVLNTLADISFQAEARGSNLLTALDMLEDFFQIGAIPHPDHVEKLEEFARYDPDKKLTVQGQLDEALADYILVWGGSEPSAPAEPDTAKA